MFDPTRACELLVGLPDVNILDVIDDGNRLRVVIEQRATRPACTACATLAWVKDRPVVEFVDLTSFGRPVMLVWRKHRWHCPNRQCATGSWVGEDERIAPPRMLMTSRAGRWATRQVGEHGRAISGVAGELACDWHTINATVVAYGEVLLADPARVGTTTALGLDETLFVRRGPYHQQCWATSIVDVAQGRLLDMIEGRDVVGPCVWLDEQGQEWRDQILYATLDLSSIYRKVFDTMLPAAVQVADPFHVIKLANSKLDEVRRRVQNETCSHRGRKDDPLYRARRLLTRAHERVNANGETKLCGLLDAGDPKGEVRMAWHAKEVVRSVYEHTNTDVAIEFVTQLGVDLQDDSCPPEIQSLGRTIVRWKRQIAAWHQAHVSNGPTEAANNLIKRVKRVAFGFANFRNYRIRALLYAGRPNWDRLDTITPH